jgi:hypothetical protein
MRSNNITRSAILVVVALAAQVVQVAPSHATLFEELSISPRARAMGGATVAVSGDAWSFNHNPAMLGLLNQATIGTSTLRPNGTSFNRLSAVGAVSPLPGRRGGVAFGVRHFGVEYKGSQLLAEDTVSFAHGFTLFEDSHASAHLGWGMNLYGANFGDDLNGESLGQAWTWGLDVGVIATLHERTKAGFFTRNLNNPTIGVDNEQLKQLVAIGMSYEPIDGIITAFDIRSQIGEEFRFHGGTEWGITEQFLLRAGIESDPNKLTGGFSVKLPTLFSLDYAFSTGGGVLDSSHQFGLAIRFSDGGGAQQ